jgi:signal transduction histidine kinase
MAGGAAATLLLAAGMSTTIRRHDAIAAAQVAHLRAKEQEITLVERLRWTGEVVVSAGRGYLITGDPSLLGRLLKATSRFDAEYNELTSDASPFPTDSLEDEVAHDASRFLTVQRDLLAARQRGETGEDLVPRFEKELLPLQYDLEESLDRLVAQHEAALESIYAAAANERNRLTAQMYALLVLFVLVGIAVTWFFARRASVAYRTEQHALDLARKALASRDELMGLVAHDLRNPLGAISLKAALLRATADASAVVRREAESIENMTLRMRFLIASMLDVTTIEAGRFMVTPAPCPVDDLVREACDLFGDAAAFRAVSFSPPPSSAAVFVHADRERVLQVLSNLLGNALKFVPRGGEVSLSIEPYDDMARFAVSDTGPGISREHLPNLFDRFWTHEAAGNKGTGLGLFIAKGIVEAHGGRIWAVSEPGHGATFYFTLPIAPRPSPSPAPC